MRNQIAKTMVAPPRGLPQAKQIKALHCQPGVTASTDAKDISGVVTNLRPPDIPPDKQRPCSAGTESGPDSKLGCLRQPTNSKPAARRPQPFKTLESAMGALIAANGGTR